MTEVTGINSSNNTPLEQPQDTSGWSDSMVAMGKDALGKIVDSEHSDEMIGDKVSDVSATRMTAAAGGKQPTYHLFLVPNGKLGKDLDNYWNDILHVDKDVKNRAITKYLPHCTITSSFKGTESVDYYRNAIKEAIASAKGSPSVHVAPDIKRGGNVDYLKLTSPFVTSFAKEFCHSTGMSTGKVKGPPGFAFHVCLRNNKYEKSTDAKIAKMRELQNKFIDPKDPAGWSVGLFTQKNGVWTPVVLEPIN